MQALFQNRINIILSFIILTSISSNVFATDFPRISIRNGESKITSQELKMIDSKIKSISAIDINHGIIGGDDDDRIYIYGKLSVSNNNNSSEDDDYKSIPVIAVQFWMVGGNADYQYLLVLDRKYKKIYGPLKIGGRGYRDIAIYKIENNVIKACARFYGPNDPMPQPSVNGNTEFILDGSSILEYRTVVGVHSHPKGCIPRP